MENFKTQSFALAVFDSLGVSIGGIFGMNVMMNHLSAGADMPQAAMAGLMAGAPVGIAIAKSGPLITGIAGAMLEKKPLTSDVVNPRIYNDGAGWEIGSIAGLALGLAMTWNMNANPITAYDLLEKLPWQTGQSVVMEASTTPVFEDVRPS